MGGPWDQPSTDSESDKTRWLSKGNPEKMPHISDFNYHKCTSLFLSLPVWLSTCYHFPSYRALYSFHYLPSICVNSFIQSQKSRVLSLATGPQGLLPGIQSFLCLCLTSISVQGPKILLRDASGWGHLRSKGSLLHTMNNFTFCKSNNFQKSPLQSWCRWVLWL